MEGGWASTYLIDQSKVRLERLGFFKEVNVETPAVPGTDDQVDVNYAVEEQASGNITASVGFSAKCRVDPRRLPFRRTTSSAPATSPASA